MCVGGRTLGDRWRQGRTTRTRRRTRGRTTRRTLGDSEDEEDDEDEEDEGDIRGHVETGKADEEEKMRTGWNSGRQQGEDKTE